MLRNIKAYKIMGIGSMNIKMFDGCDWFPKEVRYIIKKRVNITWKARFNILIIKIENGFLKVVKGATIIMKGSNKLYSVIGETIIEFYSCCIRKEK